MARKKVKNHYVDNEKLYEEMVKYIDLYNDAVKNDKQIPRVTRYIGEAIKLIAENMAKRPNFSGYTFIDEMKSDGMENCLMYLHNYNYEKYKSPFNYFSQIVFYAFVRRIQKEEKQQYIKYKSMINQSIEFDIPLGVSPEDEDSFNSKYRTLSAKYDKPKKAKKEKVKKTKVNKESTEKMGVEKFINE